MNKALSLSVLSALLFVACSTEKPAMEDSTTDDAAMEVGEVTEVANGPVAFSEVEDSILDAMYHKKTNEDGYRAVMFTAGEGTCVDLGFPAEFSYKFDDTLGYSIIESEDAAMRDELVSMSDTGNIALIDQGFALEGIEGSVSCGGKITRGSDEGTISCTLDSETVCEATYSMFAQK